MSHAAPPTAPESPPPPKRRARSAAIGIGILVAFIVVYGLSLFGVHLLAKSAAPLKAPELNSSDDTVVLVRLEELKTVANRLAVKVLVYPNDPLMKQLISFRAFGMSEKEATAALIAYELAKRGVVSAPNALVGAPFFALLLRKTRGAWQ